MSLPDLLVIGPMRTGTTWVYEYLQERGDVCLPKSVKETFFFNRNYGKGIEWYKTHFRFCNFYLYHRIIEVAPSYFHCPDAPARVLEILGKIRLVVILRDPVERSWSHYLHLLQYGYTRAPFLDAVKTYPEILEASRYSTHIERWRKLFGNNIQVLFFEELEADATAYCRRLCDALKLEFVAPGVISGERSNQATLPLSPSLAKVGREIANFLRSRRMYYVVNFAKFIGLKRIFFGYHGTRLPQMSEKECAWLVRQLRPEVKALKVEFEERMANWRSLSRCISH